MSNLAIFSTPIRKLDNLYSLNDLHKSSGGADKHLPFRFMRLSQTQELIKEIDQTPVSVLAQKTIKGGSNPGTWVCKELVYSYAMWISAKFHLMVIRAFDTISMNQEAKEPPKLTFATVEQRAPLVKAVRQLVAVSQKKGKSLSYEDAHRIVNMRMGVENIECLQPEQISSAVSIVGEILEKVVLEGEFIPKGEPEPKMQEMVISCQQRYELTEAIKDSCVGWVYRNAQGCISKVENLIRYRLNIKSVSDIPQSEFSHVLQMVDTIKQLNSIALGLFSELRDDYFKNVVLAGIPWTGDLKKKYKAKFNQELPNRPDWMTIHQQLKSDALH